MVDEYGDDFVIELRSYIIKRDGYVEVLEKGQFENKYSERVTVTVEMVKSIRGETGHELMDCRRALIECDGEKQEAIEYLDKRGW